MVSPSPAMLADRIKKMERILGGTLPNRKRRRIGRAGAGALPGEWFTEQGQGPRRPPPPPASSAYCGLSR